MPDTNTRFDRLRGTGGTFTQIIRFLVCGGLAALANLAVGYLLYGTLGLNKGAQYQMSIVIAYSCGMLVNFLLNRHFTFRSYSRRMVSQARTFFLVSMLGLGLTVLLSSLIRFVLAAHLAELTALVGLGKRHEALAHIVAVGLVSIYSFVGHKYMTFDQGSRAWIRRLLQGSDRSKVKPRPLDAE